MNQKKESVENDVINDDDEIFNIIRHATRHECANETKKINDCFEKQITKLKKMIRKLKKMIKKIKDTIEENI